MAGHSKWKQIKHYKAATDKKRGALFTKLIREITVAAKAGGGDPNGNARLRTAIDAAKANSMPKDNIERAIKKGTGELEGETYTEVTYEGYGPAGVAIIVDAVTDNPTRTVADVRHKFSRLGGNMGATNSVGWMFEKKGQIIVNGAGIDEDSAMEAALDAGAEDVVGNDDGSFEVVTGPYDFVNVKDALAKAGFVPEFAEVTMKPSTDVEMAGEDAERMRKLLDALESLDDVQEVYTSAVLDETA